MSDTRIREPFDAGRAAIVLALGLVLVAGLKVADGLRRIWARVRGTRR